MEVLLYTYRNLFCSARVSLRVNLTIGIRSWQLNTLHNAIGMINSVKLYHRHSELIDKYEVGLKGLKTPLQQGISESLLQ